MNLTKFLLARIAEDEAIAHEGFNLSRDARFSLTDLNEYADVFMANPGHILAKCTADRAVISTLTAWAPDPSPPDRVETDEHDAWRMLCALALPYVDHPDFNESWRDHPVSGR